VTVVNFVDKKILDEQNIQHIGEQLFGLVEQDGLSRLLLNFGNVEYLSSAALGKLITLNKKVKDASGKLILCNISPQIFEVFEITRLDKFFKIEKDEQTGLQAF
jgi:anti-sigma B factor antagonist